MTHRQRRFCGKIWLLLMLLLLATGAQSATTPLSMIEIPMRLSLDPLASAAEKALPQQAGNWRSWKDWHGIKSQYRAWRGPLSITASGDVLMVQAHIRYWIRAQKKLLGAINLKGSCGIDEAPRQALIGMQVRLGWGPDWTLRPEFRILPTRFLDRCEMTIANIDVTPLVEKEFRKQMQHSLRVALQTFAPGVNAIQQQAQRTWSLLQEPVALGQGHWLVLRPAGVALSRITGRGNFIDTQLALTLQPLLVTAPEAVGKLHPLPPLGQYISRSDGLDLKLAMKLDFTTLNRKLSDILAGQSLVIQDRKAGIEEIALAGSGQELRARLELSGQIAGSAELHARLAYDAEQQKLQLQDLAFDYAAEDATMGLLADAFHDQIRQSLEVAANQALSQQLALLGERLRTVLKKITPAGVALDMSAMQLRDVHIQILEQGISLEGTASGRVQLLLR
jgi:hypothetical protein